MTPEMRDRRNNHEMAGGAFSPRRSPSVRETSSIPPLPISSDKCTLRDRFQAHSAPYLNRGKGKTQAMIYPL
jgi:hypothetical protein